ncbi:MAG: ATP-binding protein [Cyanobacteria bacterium J06633_1]
MPEEQNINAEGERSIAFGDQAADNQINTGDNRSITIEKDSISSQIISGNGNKVVIYQYQLERQSVEETASTTGDIGANPYKGLLAFQSEDGGRYFGREGQIKKLWNLFRTLHEKITQPEPPLRLLPILGPSGCGKSSLARAGLIPELAQRPLPGKSQARVMVLVPGTHPVEALATVLARVATNDPIPVAKTKEFEQVLKETNDTTTDTIIYDGLRRIANVLPEIAVSPLVVLVDQFEEVYSLCEDTTERQIFIENLIHAAADRAGSVSVLITLRSDFLGETQRHPTLNQVIAKQGAIVPAMSEEELRRAITKPAELAGHPLDKAVVNLLLEQTQGREGALPLLQFALTRIWEGLKKGVEPNKTLEDVGGVGGALADEAERIYQSLDDREKQIARRIFLGLVQLGEGTSDTRRRANVGSLVSYKDQSEYVKRVIDRFANPGVRLLTLSSEQGTETAEVTHEALFVNWGQMKEWLDNSRSDIHFQHRLNEAARIWHENGRPKGNLWHPPDLDLLEKYYQRASDNMTFLQVEFFQTSKQAENNRKRLFRLGIGGLVAGFAITTATTVAADYQAKVSSLQEKAARAQNLLSSDSPMDGLVLGIQATGESHDW